MRKVFEIFLNKFITFICKVCKKNGTSLPGSIIYNYLDKNILDKINYPKYVIAVTGSSGKGSTSNYIYHILTNNGYTVAYNSYGSNGINGAVTLILNNSNLKGNFKKDVLLLECDERHLKLIFKNKKPTHMVITNITRDQPVRNVSPYNILGEIKKAIGEDTHLIINGDDAIVSELKINYKNITTFGLSKTKDSYTKNNQLSLDQTYCPICHQKLEFSYYHYGHLGNYKCPNNDFKRDPIDYEATDISLNKKTMQVKNSIINLNNNALYTCYNELAAYTLTNLIGLKDEEIIPYFNEKALPPKRGKKLMLKDREIIMLESKNENNISYYQSMKYIKDQKGIKTVILGFENVSRRYKENDLSWLYDTDFELLKDKNIDKIFCIGRFKYDVATRLEYAGVDMHKIVMATDLHNLLNLVEKKSKGTIYTMVCFDMTEVIKKLIKGENR